MTNIFYLYIFSEISQIQELFPVLEKVYFQKLLIFLLLTGVVSTGYKNYLWERMQTAQVKVLFLMSVWMVITVPFSVYPGGSFVFLSQTYWKVLVTFLIVISYVVSIETIGKTIWAYVLGAGVMCLFAFTASGESRLEVLESQDANEMAAQLCVAFPFAFWKAWSANKLKKILPLLVCALIVVVVIKTQSRGAFLGFLILSFVIIYQVKLLKGHLPIKGIVIALLVGVVLVMNYVDSDYVNRISSIWNYEEDYNYNTEEGRLAVWVNGIKMVIRSPIVGVGVNSFISADGMYKRGEAGKWNAAHNSFLQVGTELGIPGLIMYLYLILSSLKQLARLSKKPSDVLKTKQRLMAFSLLGSLIAFCVTGFFLSLAFGTMFIILLALSSSYLNIKKPIITNT